MRRCHYLNQNLARVSHLTYSNLDFFPLPPPYLPLSPRCTLGSSHTGLPAVPGTHQVNLTMSCTCLRTLHMGCSAVSLGFLLNPLPQGGLSFLSFPAHCNSSPWLFFYMAFCWPWVSSTIVYLPRNIWPCLLWYPKAHETATVHLGNLIFVE